MSDLTTHLTGIDYTVADRFFARARRTPNRGYELVVEMPYGEPLRIPAADADTAGKIVAALANAVQQYNATLAAAAAKLDAAARAAAPTPPAPPAPPAT